MTSVKETIHQLFYEAFYFVEKTPVSDFEKYERYAENLANSFNRLFKELQSEEDKNEIIDWCINNDELLIIELVVSPVSASIEADLKRNYNVLKNIFLNKIETLQVEKQKKISNVKLTAKHHALAYLFEIYAYGKNLPISDGGLAKSELEEIGNKRMKKNGNGFYKEVSKITKDYDINSNKDLEQISKKWKEITLLILNNDEKVIKYIESKGL